MINLIKRISISELLVVVFLFTLHLFFVFFTKSNLGFITLFPKNLFLFQLLEISFSNPSFFIYIVSFLNFLLIFWLANIFFGKSGFLYPLIVYSFSPWIFYSVAFNSHYVFLLFIVLLIISGIVFVEKGKRGALFLLFFAIFLGMVSDFFLFFLIPVFFILYLIIFGSESVRKFIYPTVFSLFVLFVFLFFFLFKLRPGFFAIAANEFGIFDDPGFMNMVNTYRGESSQEGFVFLSRLVENKYFLGLEFLILRFLSFITPATYFTSQERFFGFSFSPPIFIGFLIPFLYGLYRLISDKKARKFLFLSLILILPSFFSSLSINLSRLIIFSPIIIFAISYGFIGLLNFKKSKAPVVLVWISIFLLIFQLFLTVYDIKLKEKERFLRYYNFDSSYKIKI
ncbi:MAG: hypothetical protein KatS3mg088_440 [Patescibacteria group bacterium]|nr:MAG: hypothetical protein KatS3mg088_440 [Patescibacteria group bacterium]